jgi:hypothetical protein
MIVTDKPSSILQTFVSYSRKKIYNIGPWSEKEGGVRGEGKGGRVRQTMSERHTHIQRNRERDRVKETATVKHQ